MKKVKSSFTIKQENVDFIEECRKKENRPSASNQLDTMLDRLREAKDE